MKIKLKPSTKIAIGFALLVAGVYGIYRGLTSAVVSGITFETIPPKKVNLVGVKPDKRFSIVIANQIATLMLKSNSDFAVPDADSAGGQESDKKRIPISLMVKALAGDPVASGKFVMVMNDISDADMPPEQVIWTQADLEKALAGDASLKQKLEEDLNVTLEGKPLSQIRLDSVENGIVIQVTIPLKISSDPAAKMGSAQLLLPFRSNAMRAVSDKIKGATANVTNDMIRGYYATVAQGIASGKEEPQNVKKAIQKSMDAQVLKSRAALSETILQACTVIVTDDHIAGATLSDRYGEGRNEFYDIHLNLNTTGRNRLWKFSHNNIGFQLLFIVNGVAIAGPKMSSEVISSDVKITQMTNRDLAQGAVDQINKLKT